MTTDGDPIEEQSEQEVSDDFESVDRFLDVQTAAHSVVEVRLRDDRVVGSERETYLHGVRARRRMDHEGTGTRYVRRNEKAGDNQHGEHPHRRHRPHFRTPTPSPRHPSSRTPHETGPDTFAQVRDLQPIREQEVAVQREQWIHVRHDAARLHDAAVGELHALGAALVDHDPRHVAMGHDPYAEALGLARHGLGNRAHPAYGVAPCAPLAVHLAHDVVQQHIGRAGRIGARKIADDRAKTQGGLDAGGLEPAIEQIARALGQEISRSRRVRMSRWRRRLPVRNAA